jgi:quinol monooxygenase YgiN
LLVASHEWRTRDPSLTLGMTGWLTTRYTKQASMLIVQVFVHVKPDAVDAFAAATLENARNSVREPGIVRFDVVQQDDDPTRFVLVEIYRTPADPARHKETAHYLAWRDTVEPMMAEPRRSVKYHEVFPDSARWEMPG